MKTRTDAAKILFDQGWTYEEVKGVFDESDRLAGLAKLSERLVKKQEHVEKMQQESDRRSQKIVIGTEIATPENFNTQGWFVKTDVGLRFKVEKILGYELFKVDPSINPPIDSFCIVEVRDGAVVKILDRRD